MVAKARPIQAEALLRKRPKRSGVTVPVRPKEATILAATSSAEAALENCNEQLPPLSETARLRIQNKIQREVSGR